MKIGITGSGSTGKSTLLHMLEKDPRFKDYSFFDNVTRDVQKRGLAINEQGTDETQIAIMDTHEQNLKTENFIATRIALDCLCYSAWLYEHNQISQETIENLEDRYQKLISQYDIIFYVRPEFRAVDDGVRSSNQNFVGEIAEIFDEVIIRDNLDVYEIHGTVEDRMNQIYRVLKNVQQRN